MKNRVFQGRLIKGRLHIYPIKLFYDNAIPAASILTFAFCGITLFHGASAITAAAGALYFFSVFCVVVVLLIGQKGPIASLVAMFLFLG